MNALRIGLIIIVLMLQGCAEDSNEDVVYTENGNGPPTTTPIKKLDVGRENGAYTAPANYNNGGIYEERQNEDPVYYQGSVPSKPIAQSPTNIPTAVQSADYTTAKQTLATPRQNDLDWVKHQQPSSYTIELATDPKRSKVAYSVYKTPKTSRTVQFGYKDQQQKMYTGVIGSYSSKEEAQKALDAMPQDVKQSAKVQQWQTIQSKAVKAEPDEKPSVSTPNVNGGGNSSDSSSIKSSDEH